MRFASAGLFFVGGNDRYDEAMRRCLVLFVLLLLLGAITNIVVAWGLSLRSWQSTGGESWLVDQIAVDWWRTHAPPGFPDAPAGMYESHRFGNRISSLYETEEVRIGTSYFAHRFAYGWPMVSFEFTDWTNLQARTSERRRAIQLSGWPFAPGTGRAIPLSPIWLAFAVNTLVYAAILLLLYGSTVVVRRRRRIRRGLCPACAYPVGTSAVCTECGKPVKAASVEPASS
jgi:hypothetical protein